MKKTLALLMSVTLVAFAFTGCGSSNKGETVNTDKDAVVETEGDSTTAEGDTAAAVKTGLAVTTSTSNSKDAADEDGLGQVDSTIVAVTVDADGKIVDCVIDAAQTKINFSKEGKLTTDVATEFKTKQELGADYGMSKGSSIGKEWYEEVNALADYVVGKTVEEVKGIAVTEEGKPSDEDLASSVTLSIGGYISGIEKAVANAQDLGAKAGDKLGLGVTTNIAKSTDAGEEDGVAEAYSNYAVVTTDSEGKITSCVIDASQTDVNFSTEGKITSDIAATYQTKVELGDNYGMKKASSIGKEWYEEVKSFSDYVVGKNVDEVKGIAVTEEGKAADSDLASSVTVTISGYITLLEKAIANAQ